MKRIALFLLSVLACAVLFVIPASAKDRSDLEQVYNDLAQYLYTPYFNHSQYFDEYESELATTKDFLDRTTLTSAEINSQYSKARDAYAKLAKDVFDYSSLDLLIADFELLDIDLFEEESWQDLYDLMEEIYDEVDCPTLFKKGSSTKETYYETVNAFIADFTSQFQTLYNNLKLRDLPENLTQEQLGSLLNYCNVTTRKNFMGSNPYWSDYSDALEEVSACIEKRNPEQEEIDLAADHLFSAYKRLTASAFDFSAIQNELDRFRTLNAIDYTESSFSRYQSEVQALEKVMDTPQFLYLSADSDFESGKALIGAYFQTIAKPAVDAFENLVPQAIYSQLIELCSTYRNVACIEGLEVKWNLLQESVAFGQEVLSNNDATLSDVNKAIDGIESAAKNLISAEKYLLDEQNSLVQQDVGTIQLIVIFLALAIILSVIFACVVSYRHFGRLNWKK